MKTIDVINLLKEQGHSVDYSKRKDGGYYIHEIDGQKFHHSEGNKFARQITGTPLSTRVQKQRIKASISRTSQLNKKIGKKLTEEFNAIKKEYKKQGLELKYKTKYQLYKAIKEKGKKKVKRTLSREKSFLKRSKSFREDFNKAQEAWNKNKNLRGKVTPEKAVASARRIGTKAARQSLRQMTRYAQGYANNKNVEWFVLQVKLYMDKKGDTLLQSIINYALDHQNDIKDEWLMKAYEYLYNIDNQNKKITLTEVNDLLFILAHK